MGKSVVEMDFQLIDNYISEFSLTVFNKIQNNSDLEIEANVGFRIININEKDMIGQIELKYDVDIVDEVKNVGKIILIMNALFKGKESLKKEQFEEKLKIDGATIVSHLCRAYINSATALSGMPTINMPLINFNQFFEEAVEESNVNTTK